MVSKRSDGFAARESGAASFDWVILAVGVFGLGLAIYSLITAQNDIREGVEPIPVEQAQSIPADNAQGDSAQDAGAQDAGAQDAGALPLLYPYFDEAWRQDQAAFFASLDNEALLSQYRAQYAVATGPVNTLIGADYLGVIEAEMRARGLPVPEGNEPAAQIHARLSSQPGLP